MAVQRRSRFIGSLALLRSGKFFFPQFFHRYSSLLWLNEVARTIVYTGPQSEPLILPQRNVARLGKNMKTPCVVFTSIYTRQCEPCRPLSEQDRFISAIAPWYENTGITDMPMSAVDPVDTSFEPF